MNGRIPLVVPWLIALGCIVVAVVNCFAQKSLAAQGKDGGDPQKSTAIQQDGGEPPAINPFGVREPSLPDAQPGFAELSDGQLLIGQLYLTRDTRLKVFDPMLGRQREIPWNAIARIDSRVQREWMERQWRFKENASDEKVYTGHSYPTREMEYEITLRDGRKIRGPVSGLLYIQTDPKQPARRVLLNKRQKGELDQPLTKLVFLRRVRLGDQAAREARERTEPPDNQSDNQSDNQLDKQPGQQPGQQLDRRKEGQRGVAPEVEIR